MSIHAMVIGNLGKPAETKTLQSGKVVTNFSVATKGREKESAPIWVGAAMWGERGRRVAEYLTKGTKVAISGTLTQREHSGKTYLEMDVQELELLGGGEKKREDDEPPF